MDVKIIYPHINKRSATIFTSRLTVYGLLALAAVVCGIVNICTGGTAWSLLVIGAEVLFWAVFVDRPLVDMSFMGLFTRAVTLVCGYLLLIEVVVESGWAIFVVMIIAFSMLIVQSLLFFIWFKRQKHNLLPLFWSISAGLVIITVAIMGYIRMNWAVVTLGGLSLVALLLSFILYPEQIQHELRKKFHM